MPSNAVPPALPRRRVAPSPTDSTPAPPAWLFNHYIGRVCNTGAFNLPPSGPDPTTGTGQRRPRATSGPLADPGTQTRNTDQHRCARCPQTFPSARGLLNHERWHDDQDAALPVRSHGPPGCGFLRGRGLLRAVELPCALLFGLLFNLVVDPVIRGVQGDSDAHNILAYADDLTPLAGNPAENAPTGRQAYLPSCRVKRVQYPPCLPVLYTLHPQKIIERSRKG
ncbi:hypothetical protein MTO96_029510 [Rhipicephalus appendiculatus]